MRSVSFDQSSNLSGFCLFDKNIIESGVIDKHKIKDSSLRIAEMSKAICEKIDEFIEWLESANIDPTIKSLNEKCLEIKEDSLEYLFRKLNLDVREQKLVDRMMESALKRLIREPIVKLKQVKDKGKRDEYIKLIEELFEV